MLRQQLFALVLGSVVLCLAVEALGAGTPVKIYWDSHHVPYIQCRSDAGLLYGQGWALASCQYPTLRLHQAKSAGYSAKYLAKAPYESNFFVENDQIVKHIGLPKRAHDVSMAMPQAVLEMVQAFIEPRFRSWAARIED